MVLNKFVLRGGGVKLSLVLALRSTGLLVSAFVFLL